MSSTSQDFTGKLQMFENRLLKMYKHKSKLARRQNITCYRVYDHDLPEFPFSIELYADKVYLAEYLRRHGMTEEEHDEWLKSCLDVMHQILEVKTADIFVRQRRRMSHREQDQYEKLDLRQDFFTIEENGLKFLVNLTDYLDTGLFLDHRITRQMVRERCAGKNVLNLFCYTGSFSVYAADGDSRSVTSVDLSKTYLKWAEDNFAVNDFKGKNYRFVHADVKQYLKTIPAESFDLIVLDPPTFSNSKRMKDFLDIQRDHVELINDCVKALTQNGLIYFSTNFTRFILEADKIKAASIKNITKATTPFDFEGNLNRWCYLFQK